MKLQKLFFFFCIFFINKIVADGIIFKDFSSYNIDHEVSGYIKFESFVDSRQVLGIAADHFLLFPENKDLDANGKDKNSNSQTQLVALESRLRYDFSGPEICDVPTHAVIEGDFFSNAGQINFFTDV